MANKIAVSIQKGGVGKTTTAVIISELLAQAGMKVLLIDLDSQGNATEMLTGEDIYTYSGKTILEAMKERDPRPYLVCAKENLDILPAEDMLVTFSRYIYTRNLANKMHVLGDTIDRIEDQYDYVIMDCPPALSDITLNAIAYADQILVPVQLGGFCLTALDRFVDFVEGARAEGHTEAELLGIAFTMKDRSRAEKEIADSIRSQHGEAVFATEIRKKAKLKEYSLIGTQMRRKADIEALNDYINLTEELVERIERGKHHGK